MNELSDAEELLRKEISKLKGQITRHKSVEQIIKAAVFDAMGDRKNIEIPQTPRLDRRVMDSEVAVLHYSDSQIGKTTDSYNTQIAADRLNTLVDKTLQITNVRRNSAKIEEIHLYLGGDIVEGDQIFAGQAHEIDSNVFQQAVTNGSEMITSAVLKLLENFRKVKVVGVPGNHGRNGKYGGDSHADTNWDSVCYSIVHRNLLGSTTHPRREFAGRLEFPGKFDWFYIDRIYNWGNLIVHGDQITGGGGGFPLASIRNRALGWIDSMTSPWDYLYLGHFHTYTSFMLNHRFVLANGTTESGNDFAKKNLGATGWPVQRLAFYNEKHGLISDNPVYLENRTSNMDRAKQF